MARLQDFQNVTPTSSDKILIVQSQGQGLAPHTIKLDSVNPTGTGKLSLNRKANTTEGTNSVTLGGGNEASADNSLAEGYQTKASEERAHSEGYLTVAGGRNSHCEGQGTEATRRSQHVFGEYNTIDTSGSSTAARGTYVEMVGNGTSSTRSNARTLDWSGNEVLAGGLKINGNQDVGIAPVGYNANTDRNTESVRQTAMRYLRTNCFSKGGSSSSVRYSGGYYFTYLFGGVTSYGYDTFVEFAQSLTSGEKIIYWGYNVTADTFTKLFSIS